LSKEAAERWRDHKVIEADSAAIDKYAKSEARAQLLESYRRAELCLQQMGSIGQQHAVRQWLNLLAAMQSQLSQQAAFPPGYLIDPECGAPEPLSRPSVVDVAKNKLLELDLREREPVYGVLSLAGAVRSGRNKISCLA
jgi:hypothetical protein